MLPVRRVIPDTQHRGAIDIEDLPRQSVPEGEVPQGAVAVCVAPLPSTNPLPWLAPLPPAPATQLISLTALTLGLYSWCRSEVEPGDCIVHSRCVVHGSLPNTSPHQRVTLYMGFFPFSAVSHNEPEAIHAVSATLDLG